MIASTGRDLEDQADRVGLRYAFEGGFDVRQGPRLWRRFREKYAEPDKITNFFFGSHAGPTSRIQSLEREIALNYQRGTIEKCKRIDKREVDQVSA